MKKSNFYKNISIRRRSLLQAFAASTLASTAVGSSASDRVFSRSAAESRSLDEIYQAAIAEGGKLVVYAGGDFDGQYNFIVDPFTQRFPEIEVEYIVDYSKFHNARIDAQISSGEVIPDIAQLQTLNDFTRWAREGRLMQYKPAGFDQIHPLFRDKNGYSMALLVFSFSYSVNQSVSGGGIPSVSELTQSNWKGKIASSYPHDDDAVEFLFKLYTDAYGLDWLEAMGGQDLDFNRGSHVAGNLVNGGQKAVGLGVASSLLFNDVSPGTWVVPEREPFMAWGQRAGILKNAKHPEAAKLYMNYMLSEAVQANAFTGWSVRTDVTPAGGLPPIWEYDNAFLFDFAKFMEDRQEVEIWRQLFALVFGDVSGAPTPGRLGLRPGA